MGVDETIAISRETAMKKSNLLNTIYANTDRDMWVVYSKINEDGTTTQAYEREYVNVPFYQYLSTLNFDKNHNLKVESYMTEKKRELTMKVFRGKNMIDDAIHFTADRKLISLNLKVKPLVGDMLELRDRNTNELVDRLLVR